MVSTVEGKPVHQVAKLLYKNYIVYLCINISRTILKMVDTYRVEKLEIKMNIHNSYITEKRGNT